MLKMNGCDFLTILNSALQLFANNKSISDLLLKKSTIKDLIHYSRPPIAYIDYATPIEDIKAYHTREYLLQQMEIALANYPERHNVLIIGLDRFEPTSLQGFDVPYIIEDQFIKDDFDFEMLSPPTETDPRPWYVIAADKGGSKRKSKNNNFYSNNKSKGFKPKNKTIK